MPTTTAAVEKVRIAKTGETNGRPWTLYVVHAGGKEYRTFDDSWQQKVGQTVELDYDEVPNGQYMNYRIKDPKRQRGGGGNQSVVLGEIRDLLKEQNDLLRQFLVR